MNPLHRSVKHFISYRSARFCLSNLQEALSQNQPAELGGSLGWLPQHSKDREDHGRFLRHLSLQVAP
jgi:hypothetical protein